MAACERAEEFRPDIPVNVSHHGFGRRLLVTVYKPFFYLTAVSGASFLDSSWSRPGKWGPVPARRPFPPKPTKRQVNQQQEKC